MSTKETASIHERWAQLRFAVVGRLLAAPPGSGELKERIEELAQTDWTHPSSGQAVRFGASTIERWYYQAKNAGLDPVGRLKRKPRKDLGQQRGLNPLLRQALLAQYAQHPSWSMQLHTDNLRALVDKNPQLGPMRSYGTIRRFMKGHGLLRKKRRKKRPGDQGNPRRHETREVRSFEVDHVGALWHLDFHHGSRKILTADGQWVTPILLGVLDDHSRLCCHVQWYLRETAENLIHGLNQAILKRGLPRALMTDNGAAMTAAETQQGLERLGILQELTLPYSPYQNAKQEVFWAQVEGRLMSMLEGVDELSLPALNEATQAWAEMEYHRKPHRELGEAPVERFARAPSVLRESPDSAVLALAFTQRLSRVQRRSDGTITVDGVRFEVPSRYRHFERVRLRYASWDLSRVHLCDDRSDKVLCRLYPVDKSKNADGVRRVVSVTETPTTGEAAAPPAVDGGLPPLLNQLIEDYNRAGLPPAYLVKNEQPVKGTGDE